MTLTLSKAGHVCMRYVLFYISSNIRFDPFDRVCVYANARPRSGFCHGVGVDFYCVLLLLTQPNPTCQR